MDVVCANACSNKDDCNKIGAWFSCGHTMCIKAALHCGYCIECGEEGWSDPRPFWFQTAQATSICYKVQQGVLMAKDAMKIMNIGFEEPGMMAFTIIHGDSEDGMTPFLIKVFNRGADDKARFWDMMKQYKNKQDMVFTALDRPDRNGIMRHILAIRPEEGDYGDPVVALTIQRAEAGTIFWFSVKENRDKVIEWLKTKKMKTTKPSK